MHNALTRFSQALGALMLELQKEIIQVVWLRFGVRFLHCLENYLHLGTGTRSDFRARHLKEVALCNQPLVMFV